MSAYGGIGISAIGIGGEQWRKHEINNQRAIGISGGENGGSLASSKYPAMKSAWRNHRRKRQRRNNNGAWHQA
jgi:hypothetical protein